MTCFSRVFADKELGIKYEHPKLLYIMNTSRAAEVFFSDLWAYIFNEPIIHPKSITNPGWDFKTRFHEIEVKTTVGREINRDAIKFQINKLLLKQKSYLCTVLDFPSNEYCYIGVGVPPKVWLPLMSNTGVITLTINPIDMKLKSPRADTTKFMSYHTLFNKSMLGELFDAIKKESRCQTLTTIP